MKMNRFDTLAKHLGCPSGSRRGVLSALGGGSVAALFARGRPGETAAAGCRKNGKDCERGDQCCSGACRHHRCRRAPGQGTCTIDQDFCAGSQHACNGDLSCECFVTTKGASFCGMYQSGLGIVCADCDSTADCVAARFPAGSACIKIRGACGGCTGSHRACVSPFPTPFP